MSLINDALKKAQKQRTGDAPDLAKLPAIGGEPAARIARRDKPPAFNSMILWIGVGATTVLILTVGAFFLIRWMMKSPEATANAPIVAQSMPSAKETPTPTATPSATKPAPSVVTVQPSVPEVVVETKTVAVAPTEAPAPVEAPKPVVAAAAPKMASKAVAYIDSLRVAGVRASGAESKVLMNDRVYRIGDTVEHVLGLKLAAITVDSLTFEDENGARYTRNL